ncbi:acyl-CoA dehydrogenase family protein [Anabaena minutissima FACHB-250]|nr:acyl-CoA dehydrogenase family protein [Anabaena minutissima FACHB-250]
MQLFEYQQTDYVAIAATFTQELAATAIERDRQAGLPTQEVQQLRESGLLPLVIPKEYGGMGATWVEALKVVQEFAKSEGSIGQLYANQLILSVLPFVSGTPAQAEHYCRATAQHHLFWGNAFNTRDTRLIIEPEENHYRVNGIKSFGTGVALADMRVFAAVQEGVEFPIIFIIPKDRAGVTYNDDWDNMGQRRTASGSFTFDNVLVMPDEILPPPSSPFATFLFIVNQLAKTHIYLGLAEGAFAAARKYTITMTRPWLTSGVERASQDPYILRHYGELWTQLQAAIALAEQTVQKVQTAWEKGEALTHQERSEVAIAVYTLKAFVTKVGLDISNRMFEVMGARSTAASYGFDRYWRDLRTFTLHDPVDYKLHDIGNFVLNSELPMPSQYS